SRKRADNHLDSIQVEGGGLPTHRTDGCGLRVACYNSLRPEHQLLRRALLLLLLGGLLDDRYLVQWHGVSYVYDASPPTRECWSRVGGTLARLQQVWCGFSGAPPCAAAWLGMQRWAANSPAWYECSAQPPAADLSQEVVQAAAPRPGRQVVAAVCGTPAYRHLANPVCAYQ